MNKTSQRRREIIKDWRVMRQIVAHGRGSLSLVILKKSSKERKSRGPISLCGKEQIFDSVADLLDTKEML